MLLPLWVTLFASGLATALLTPPRAVLIALGLAGLGAAVARLRARAPATGGAALAFAAGLAHGHLAEVELSRGPPAFADGQTEVVVDATVVRGPLVTGTDREAVWLVLETARVAGAIERRGLALTVRAGSGGLSFAGRPGDRIRFRAALRAPRGLANPGLPDAARLARAKGIELQAAVTTDALTLIAPGHPLAPRRLAQRLHDLLGGVLESAGPPPVAAFLRGVILGDRTAVDPAIEEGFRAAGATHVLSVSGLHLATVSGLVFLLLRGLLVRSAWLALRTDPGAVAAALALPLVALYTLLTGEAVATLRAAFMAALLLGAGLVRRSPSFPSALAAAALVLLVGSPFVLLDLSFQLSFASVISLALWARARPRVPSTEGQGRARRVWRWIGGATAASAAAAIATAPLCAHHFAEVSPASPIGNLVLIPLVELAVVPAGLSGALLGAVHPWLGLVPLQVAALGARVAIGAAAIFRSTAPLLPVRSPNALETALLLAGVVAALLALGRGGVSRRRLTVVGVGCALLGGASLAGRDLARDFGSDVEVTFLDVGQGDAALVEGPRGFTALVDGGGAIHGAFDPGARVIEPVLRRKGISRIDLVVLSHPHPDHMNGLLRIVDRFEIGALWTSGDDGRNPVYAELLGRARRQGVPTPTPSPIERGHLRFEPLGPWLGDQIGAPPGLSVNDASLVVRLVHRGRAVLFSGDLEEDGEAELVGRVEAGLLSAASDVLKVPHHGSRTSSTPELLDAVAPGLAVISLGHLNRFGFPKPEVLGRLEARGIRVLRTDEHGAVTVRIGEDGRLEATCVRSCR